ncbi:MAG TPA: hypothetical protein ENK42_00155 [Deltaproteobacteria bacterium]|nr:hypothetical protein [Deltaproteobacteria bacterium]
MESFFEAIIGPLKAFFINTAMFIPHLMVLVVIVVIGLVVALAARAITARLLSAIGFDTWSAKLGFASLLQKGGVAMSPSQFSSQLVYWFILIVFGLAALSTLGTEITDTIVSRSLEYIPRLISAGLLLVIGWLVASFIARAILIACVNAGVVYARFIADGVKILILILIFAMAFEELHIAPGMVKIAFSILFGGIVLALALAFGLGGRDVARKILEERIKKGEKKEDHIEHL